MKWGKADFKEFKKFAEKVSEADVQKLHEDIVKDLAARALRKIVKTTPVDTGNLKRNWKVGNVKKTGDTYEIEIYNNTEYAPYIEYGHRTKNGLGYVQGRFMMTIAVAEVKALSSSIVEKKLSAFINEVMRND